MYEVHLTVKTDNISKFREDCEKVGVKPLLIDLQELRTGESIQQDVMTSSSYRDGTWEETAAALILKFENMGYEILRVKGISTFPGICSRERIMTSIT